MNVEELSGRVVAHEDTTERKRVEGEVLENELHFRAIFDNALDAMLIADDEAHYVDANPAACALFGVSKDEIVGRKIAEFGEPGRGLEIQEAWKAFIERGEQRGVFRLYRGDGTTRELEYNAKAHLLPGRHLSILRDVTERKQAEEALRLAHSELEKRVEQRTAELAEANQLLEEQVTKLKQVEAALTASESRCKAAQRIAHLGNWERDLSTNLINASAELCHIFGIDPQEPIYAYETLFNLIHPEDQDFVLDVTLRALQDQKPFNLEYRIIRPDESLGIINVRGEVVSDEAGKPIKVRGIAQDITERKRGEDELRRQKEILQKIFDYIPLIIGFADESGRLKLVNREWERTLGWSLEEIEKQKLDIFAELYPDAQEHQKVLDFIAESNGEWADFKTRARNGRVIDTTWASVHLSDGTRIGIGQDITWRKCAEEENQKLLRDLAERIKELTALHGAARILQREWTDTATVLRELAALLPSAVQYSEVAAARICIGQIEVATPRVATSRFAPSPSALRADFTTADNQPGRIEVLYTEDRPPAAIGPFLIEEHDLINTVADMLRTAYDRRQAEIALRESEGRFRQLAENIREVFWMRTPDIYEILYVSPAYGSVWGRPRETLDSNPRSFIDAIHTEDRQRVVETIERERDQGFEVEYRIVKPDGSARWIRDRGFPIEDESGRVYRIAGLAEDITERKHAEEALVQSERDYRTLFDQAHDAIFIFEPESEIVLNVNQRACEIYGFSKDELIGMSIEKISPNIQRGKRHIKKTLESGRYYQFETVQCRKDGTEMHLEINASAVEYEGQRVILSINRDVTDRKRAEEERNQLMHRLITAQEDERRSISRELHDQMGQYLAALMMGLKSLQKAAQLPSPVQARLIKLQELTAQFSQDARHFALQLRPTVLDDLGLYAALTNYIEEWSKRNEIKVDLHSNGLTNRRLPAQIETTLYRLIQEALNNVLKHARAQRVSVIVEYRIDRVLVVLEDDGEGFDVAAALNAPASVRGLGLTSMRERVELVGGRLEIESAPGGGTTIVARIPILSYTD